MQLEDEAGTFGECGIDVEVTIHSQGHLLANRQSKTVALGKVTDFEERFEEVVTLLLRDAFASVGYKELVAMLSTLLVFEGYLATLRSVFYGILQKMKQDVTDVFAIHGHAHLGGVDSDSDIILRLIAHLIHDVFTELLHLNVYHLNRFRAILKFRERLNMAGEVEQCLHLRLTAVEFAESWFKLCGYITDKLSLEGIVLACQLNILLLTTGEEDKTHKHDSTENQCSSKDADEDE